MALTNRQTLASTLRIAQVPRSFLHAPASGRPNDPLTSFTFTADAATNKLATANHGLIAGERIRVANTGGALPGGLAAATDYFVIASGLTAGDFKVSAIEGGSEIDITSAGSGTNTWQRHLSTEEQAEFDIYYNFAVNGQGSLPSPAVLPRVVALINRFGQYHQSSAYLTWWHDDQLSRDTQYALRKADMFAANDVTVPISGDPAGSGDDPPVSPVTRDPT